MVGVADRVRQARTDAAVASWTISSEVDGCLLAGSREE